MPVTQVQRVVQQPLVVCAHVQGDRDHSARVDPRRGCVYGQFASRDLDAANAPVADAQDLLSIGAHDQVHIAWPEAQRGEGRLDVVRPVDGQEDAPRPTVLVGVLLDRLPDGRVVDDRQQLGQMVGQHPVVENLIAVVQLLQVYVLGQVAAQVSQLLISPPRLLFQRQNRGRQPPGQPASLPLRVGERDPPVGHRVGQHAGRARRAPCLLTHGSCPFCWFDGIRRVSAQEMARSP